MAPAAAAAPDDLAAHREAVRGLLRRLVKDDSLAEDLVQDALLRATRAMADRRGESSLRTWLTAIALNLANDHFRKTRRLPLFSPLEAAEFVAEPGHPERDILRAEMSSCILEFIDRLPERQREAVLMHHFAGLSHKEIAAALALSDGNARVTLHRGMAALKTSLERGCAIDLAADIPCERR